MQEITGAKPVRDANFTAPKALSAMRSLGKRLSSVQLRMRAPILRPPAMVAVRRSRASVQAGFISPLCPGQHRRLRPSPPPRSSLRISFVKRPCRGNTGGRLQPFCSRSPTQRHDVENVDSAGASPAASTNLRSPSYGLASHFGLQALK